MFKNKRINALIAISSAAFILISVNFYAQQQQQFQEEEQERQERQLEIQEMTPDYSDAEVARFAEVMQAVEDAGFTEHEFLEMLNVYFQDRELQQRVQQELMDID